MRHSRAKWPLFCTSVFDPLFKKVPSLSSETGPFRQTAFSPEVFFWLSHAFSSHPWGLLDASWGPPGGSWDRLVAVLDRFGAVLDLVRAVSGSCLGSLGLSCAVVGRLGVLSWPLVAKSGRRLRVHLPRQELCFFQKRVPEKGPFPRVFFWPNCGATSHSHMRHLPTKITFTPEPQGDAERPQKTKICMEKKGRN